MVRERGLRDIEQRHQLAHADLPGVLAKHVHQLKANGIAESLRHLGHADRLRALHIGVEHRIAARVPSGSLRLRRELQIDAHLSTYTN